MRMQSECRRRTVNLEKALTGYATGAVAAGVAALALAQPSDAEVVYTPANVKISGSYALDLNNDGTPDFTFNKWELFESAGHIALFYLNFDVVGNGILIGPLAKGAKIGPLQAFISHAGSYGDAFMYGTSSFFRSGSDQHASFGPWVKQTNKYVGLKFLIDNKFHYGWARVSRDTTGTTLTGYAYETVPGIRILAGQTAGNESDLGASTGRTLGALAAGSSDPSH